MFRNREYRPPWLWSLVELIRRVHPNIRPEGEEPVTRLLVHPTAAGKIRGAHNCGNCDKRVAVAIERYSVSGDLGEFDGLACECEARWRTERELDLALPIPLGCGLDRRGDVIAGLLSP